MAPRHERRPLTRRIPPLGVVGSPGPAPPFCCAAAPMVGLAPSRTPFACECSAAAVAGCGFATSLAGLDSVDDPHPMRAAAGFRLSHLVATPWIGWRWRGRRPAGGLAGWMERKVAVCTQSPGPRPPFRFRRSEREAPISRSDVREAPRISCTRALYISLEEVPTQIYVGRTLDSAGDPHGAYSSVGDAWLAARGVPTMNCCYTSRRAAAPYPRNESRIRRWL